MSCQGCQWQVAAFVVSVVVAVVVVVVMLLPQNLIVYGVWEHLVIPLSLLREWRR